MKKRWFLRRKAQQNAQPEADESTCAEAVSEETADNAETQSDAKTETGLVTIQTFTESEGVEVRNNLTLREILGGDILMNGWLKKQMGLILCVCFLPYYISLIVIRHNRKLLKLRNLKRN